MQVFAWQHTTFGASTGDTTRELRCQSCGAWFVIRARSRQIALWIVGGVLTLTTCVGGIPFFVVAWMRGQVEKSLPVLPGAPVPHMRFRGGPPLRSCSKCSGVATAIRVTRSTHNGLPTGTEYEYQCAQCSATFIVESPWGHIFAAFSGLLIAAVAAAFLLTSKSAGWRWGGGGVASAVALLLFGQVASRLLNRFRNPAIDEATPGLG